MVRLLIASAILLLAAQTAAAWQYTSRATVQVTGPRGRCYAVSVPVHYTLDGNGIAMRLTLPGPIAGQPWTCRTMRTWKSLAGELLDQVARYATPYVQRLNTWLAKREARP